MKIVKTAGINWDKGHIYWKDCQKDFAINSKDLSNIVILFSAIILGFYKERKKRENII